MLNAKLLLLKDEILFHLFELILFLTVYSMNFNLIPSYFLGYTQNSGHEFSSCLFATDQQWISAPQIAEKIRGENEILLLIKCLHTSVQINALWKFFFNQQSFTLYIITN